jgi:hypothetical protein
MVVIIDRDNKEDRYEYEIRLVSERLGIQFATCDAGFIESWATTRALCTELVDKNLDDLPKNASLGSHCDLGPGFDVGQ